MSAHNLIKATSKIMRRDTIRDWQIVTDWRESKHLPYVEPKKQTVAAIENAVALSIENLDLRDLPKLTRGKEFYISILPEIKR